MMVWPFQNQLGERGSPIKIRFSSLTPELVNVFQRTAVIINIILVLRIHRNIDLHQTLELLLHGVPSPPPGLATIFSCPVQNENMGPLSVQRNLKMVGRCGGSHL